MPAHPDPQPARPIPGRSASGLLECELVFVTEPIVELVSGDVVAREVLARPRNGMVFPSWLGRSSPLLADEVWWSALGFAQRWLEDGVSTHVNIGAPQLARSGFVTDLCRTLTSHQLENLVIEVTEHEPVDPSDQLGWNLGALRERGVSIALDDFGEGFANFASLKVLAPETVKVSRAIVEPTEASAGRAAWFLETCHSLGVRRTVVEQIESISQLGWARRLGFDAGQGFLWP